MPGVTKFSDLGNRKTKHEGGYSRSYSVVDKDGNRRGGDDVLQRGDLICLEGGRQSG